MSSDQQIVKVSSPTNKQLAVSSSSGSSNNNTVTDLANQIPDWLSTKSLPKRRYLSSSTGNLHGLQCGEFIDCRWPLPKMFGDEKYSFSLIDIEDPRYLLECSDMSKKLIHYFSDLQIFDLEWRKIYTAFQIAEKRYANLPRSASQKTKDELEKTVKKHKTYLLELQEQKDLYQQSIDAIFERCSAIKRSINQENSLESLRVEMTKRVRSRFNDDSSFWKSQFNVARDDMARERDDDYDFSE